MQEAVENPSLEVMVRLLEENIWKDAASSPIEKHEHGNDDNEIYLRAKVLPTLVPALHQLVQLQQKHLRELQSKDHHTAAAAAQRKHGATLDADPIAWLAHYLLRNNTTVEGADSRIKNHPFAVSNNVYLRRKKEDDE